MALVHHKAPDFVADAYVNGEIKKAVKLSDFRGKYVVLVFYPLDFTFVCPTELRALANDYASFQKEGAEVVGVSVDSVYSHLAWFQRDLPEVKFPVLADITKKIAKDYGVLDEDKGVALRGTFIIDPEGVVQYQVVSGLGLGRNTGETLRALQALKTGELCPADWKPGAKTLGKA
jgi:peroxiredoxin (alkyl hydroperoxide reductase subunit C)